MFNQCKHSWNLKHLGEPGWHVGSWGWEKDWGRLDIPTLSLSNAAAGQPALNCPSKPTWYLLFVTKYKDISHFEKVQD